MFDLPATWWTVLALSFLRDACVAAYTMKIADRSLWSIPLCACCTLASTLMSIVFITDEARVALIVPATLGDTLATAVVVLLTRLSRSGTLPSSSGPVAQ